MTYMAITSQHLTSVIKWQVGEGKQNKMKKTKARKAQSSLLPVQGGCGQRGKGVLEAACTSF